MAQHYQEIIVLYPKRFRKPNSNTQSPHTSTQQTSVSMWWNWIDIMGAISLENGQPPRNPGKPVNRAGWDLSPGPGADGTVERPLNLFCRVPLSRSVRLLRLITTCLMQLWLPRRVCVRVCGGEAPTVIGFKGDGAELIKSGRTSRWRCAPARCRYCAELIRWLNKILCVLNSQQQSHVCMGVGRLPVGLGRPAPFPSQKYLHTFCQNWGLAGVYFSTSRAVSSSINSIQAVSIHSQNAPRTHQIHWASLLRFQSPYSSEL